MRLRVLVAVTHLLGAGHLARAAALARAFAGAGHEASLVSGGMPAPLISREGTRFVQLPPVRVEGTDFGRLLDGAGAPAGEALMGARRAGLLAALREARPDVVITELFPFGRRALAGEFEALLEAARALDPRPLVLASLRDVLAAPSRPERAEEARGRFSAFYDGALVHGDEAFLPLDASWPVTPELRARLHYTGYVDEGDGLPPPGAGAEERSREILVSGGSSAAALPLLRAAVEAACLAPGRPWRVLAGAGVGEADLEVLRAAAPPNAAVERARAGFRALLARAAASVSLAGYNTAVDLLATRTPAVLVPFEEGREAEQRLRAERLARAGLAELLPMADLAPEALARAVERAAGRPVPAPALRLDGAARAVRIVEGMRAAGGLPAPARLSPRLDWSPLDEALRRRGAPLDLWWRDDDAARDTPALRRLLALRASHGPPLALAAVPALLEPSLLDALKGEPAVAALVHGLAHRNHAPESAKRAELGPHRSLPAIEADAAEGLALARAGLGPRLLPVLVPPWNRIAPDLVPRLPGLGYRGLSTYGPRRAVPGLAVANAHLDPVDWRGSRGLAEPGGLIARLSGLAAESPGEPIGLLTHHLVHDEAVWGFLDALLERLAATGAVRYPSVGEVFSPPDREPPGERVPDSGVGLA